jgi:hypothetical protein
VADQLNLHHPHFIIPWEAPHSIPRPPLHWHRTQVDLITRYPHIHFLGAAFGPPGINGAIRQAYAHYLNSGSATT